MKRPFADKRPIGPIFSERNSGILEVREAAYPELVVEVADIENSDDVFELVSSRAKFEVYDIILERNEGEIGTTEPGSWTIKVISGDKEVDIQDLNLLVDIIETRYTVFRSIVGASIERDPDELGIGDPFKGTKVTSEPTDVVR